MIEWHETQPFIPPITKARVIKVYDGDTITIATKLQFPDSPLYRFSVRLRGIDSSEMKSKDIVEKENAKKAQAALSNLILHQEVILSNLDNEKYGRILADVHFQDIHINEWMIENGLAVKYDGGTKLKH
jgi:hypothetical protein